MSISFTSFNTQTYSLVKSITLTIQENVSVQLVSLLVEHGDALVVPMSHNMALLIGAVRKKK